MFLKSKTKFSQLTTFLKFHKVTWKFTKEKIQACFEITRGAYHKTQ